MNRSAASGKSRKVSVVMPVYNEEKTVALVIDRVLSADVLGLEKEVVVVDDGSTDGTASVLAGYVARGSIRVLRNETNAGKGASLRLAFEAAAGDFIVIQDADLEYSPSDISLLLGPLVSGTADAVYGSRFTGRRFPGGFFFWQYLWNRCLTAISNLFTGLKLSDMETGYKAFRSDLVLRDRFSENGFGFEAEFAARLAKTGARVAETAVSYRGRTSAEGKKIGWQDGVVTLWCILKYSLFR